MVLVDVLLRPPVSRLWDMGSALHRKLYQSGLLPKKTLPKPVISIGNWTMGGTGKTPITDWFMDLAQSKNKKIIVLSRGYGRSSLKTEEVLLTSSSKQVGDEPLLLKMHHPDCPIFVGSSRYEAGMEALKKYQPDFFVLDDGFQHHQLERKINIVLIDATQGPVKHKVFPVGWARESEECLQYADWIIHTKTNFVDSDILQLRREWLEGLVKNPKNILSAEYRLSGYFDEKNRKIDTNKQEKVMAMAGVAQPENFFREIRKDFSVVDERGLEDHQEYTDAMIRSLVTELKQKQIRWLVITEKDWVKLKEFKEILPFMLVMKRKMFIEESEGLSAFCSEVFA